MTNAERRVQRTARALSPRRGTRADGDVFQAVARAMGAPWSYRTPEDVFREIARLVPGYQGMSWAMLLPLGPQWALATPRRAAPGVSVPPPAAAAEGLALLSGGTLFQQGSLGHRVAKLVELAKAPRAWLHPLEARRLGVAQGDRVKLAGVAGALELEAAVDEAVPQGSVFVPYAQVGVELNRLGAPRGSGLRVRVSRVEVAERVGA